MSIILTENGKNAKKLDKTKFTDENELQEYLYENPDVIPLYEISEDIKLLILSREFPTNSGPIDALGIDINGNLYIVETKLYKNADKRTVIAQAIDYGAALWAHFNDYADFISRLGSDVNKRFGMSLNQKVLEFFELDEEQGDQLLETMKGNLNRGIFKFVVLMDKLEPRLKDLIRFINQNSQFDVYAVELEYYKFDKHELMIPRLYGAEVKKDLSAVPSKVSNRGLWDEQSFLEELKEEVTPKNYNIIKDFYDFSKETCDLLSWGSGKRGAFSVGVSSLFPKSFITVKSNGTLVLNLGWHKTTTGELDPKAYDLADRFRNIGFDLEGDDIKQHYYYESAYWLPKIDKIRSILKDLI